MEARWRVKLDDASTTGGGSALPDPPGYVPVRELPDDGGSGKSGAIKENPALSPAFRLQKAYEFARGNLQQIGMMAFMMYMSGNSVQIFSMMITFGGIFQPIKAILNSGQAFERFADARTDVTMPRLLYCAIQLVGLAIALYKLNALGLLPTHASDWVSSLKPPTALEHAYGGTSM